MGKKGLSDKVRNKLKTKGKPTSNPFEVKVNRVKHSVLNRKIQKGEHGLPGVSRSKAIKRRKDTLLTELHHMKKSNFLYDKRIGEKDASLTADEKMIQRFAKERKNQADKGSAFNLTEEEEVLTHYGQSLAENLKDTIGSDDSDEEQDAVRRKTSQLQFGGFSKEGDEPSWKDKMKDVIADSKKHKYERQLEKEKSLEATVELDRGWCDVLSSMRALKKPGGSSKSLSSFMQLSNSLVMEHKSQGAADKMKTEEEKAKDDAEKLMKFESLRQMRMQGVTQKKVSNHVSADDLDDGFALEKPNAKQKVSFSGLDSNDENDNDEEEDKDYGTDEEEEGGSGGEEGNEDDQDGSDDEDESDEDYDENDNFSDLEDDGDDDEEESDHEESKSKKVKSGSKPVSILKKKGVLEMQSNGDVTLNVPANMDLPFIFQAPDSYEELRTLLHGHSPSQKATIISRLRKCHHPSLADTNKEKLERIHHYLLLYFGELFLEPPFDSTLLDALVSHLWELTQMFPASTAKLMQNIVIERQKEYCSIAEKRGGRGLFPQLDMLMFLRMVDVLFPTSDFRHSVTTPSIHFIAHMLAETSVRSLADVVKGLYLCALSLQYVKLSKRYIPEVLTFLHGVLFLAAIVNSDEGLVLFPPFRKACKDTCNLEISSKCQSVSSLSISGLMATGIDLDETDELRCSILNACVDVLHESTQIWGEMICLYQVLKPLQQLLKKLPTDLYSKPLKSKIESLDAVIDKHGKAKLQVMKQESKKPEPLRLFKPQIDEFWSGKQKKGSSNRTVNERQRITHKYKREMKAAIREIKRDNEVLAKHQLDTILEKDQERKRKVKELFGNLANQEGEVKAMKRDHGKGGKEKE